MSNRKVKRSTLDSSHQSHRILEARKSSRKEQTDMSQVKIGWVNHQTKRTMDTCVMAVQTPDRRTTSME